MKILTAPIKALYSRGFYAEVIRSPLSRGFLYLLYLTFIAMVLTAGYFRFQAVPAMDRFTEWLAGELPDLTWTPEGLVMNARSPYALTHPDFGPLAVIDTTRETIAPDEMLDLLVYVTATRLYFRTGEDGLQAYDLTRDPGAVGPDKQTFDINGQIVREIYGALRSVVYFIIPLVLLPLYYAALVLHGLFFSLIGLVFNSFRAPKLQYGQILNVSFFALTASALFQMRSLVYPPLDRIPFGLAGIVLLTSLYLWFALRETGNDFQPPADPTA